ncbi:hypothetical protein C2S51_001375 [Perilla frutescens var. frutescens]|nr:hypothetical protein C2S51_001375 [Perilla frutescens var. frutescens]
MNKMMKFLHKFSNQHSILRVSLYSTQIEPNSSPPLFWRLNRCNEQRVSLIPVLDEWVAQGRTINNPELKQFIRTFRRNKRFKPALEIAEWMSRSMKPFEVTPGHVAIQLDLISKVHGLKQAENFFNSLGESLRVFPVYSALLNCYAADAKSLEKTEATFEKLRKWNVPSILPYNTMMTLYSQMGMHEKLDSLMQEVESKGIDYNAVTYNIRLNAYADSDLEGMEKLLMKMEADPMASADYYSYAIAAKGYIRAGALEKASSALKKAEHLIKVNQRGFAYGGLISLYTSMHKREDVYRLWSVVQNYGKVHYGSYVYVLTALEKLDDLEGAKKIVEELVEQKESFDIRIPNLIIGAYCKKGDVEEGELILKRLVEKGKEPCGTTWGHMALGYYNSGRVEKAIEMTKKALPGNFPFWKPDLTLIAACLEHLNKKGDEEATRELLMLLEKCGSFSAEFRERIGRYLSNGKPMPNTFDESWND